MDIWYQTLLSLISLYIHFQVHIFDSILLSSMILYQLPLHEIIRSCHSNQHKAIYCSYICTYIHELQLRLCLLCFYKLPIMLWSNSPEFCLLCSKYVSQYSPQIQHFISLILLKSQNHEYQQSLFINFPNTMQFVLLVSSSTV